MPRRLFYLLPRPEPPEHAHLLLPDEIDRSAIPTPAGSSPQYKASRNKHIADGAPVYTRLLGIVYPAAGCGGAPQAAVQTSTTIDA